MLQAFKFGFPLLAIALTAMFLVNTAQSHVAPVVAAEAKAPATISAEQSSISPQDMQALAVMMNEIEPQAN